MSTAQRSPLVSLVLITFQLFTLHKSHWDTHSAQGIRRLLALFVTLLIVFLSALSGSLGLVACQASYTQDHSRAARAVVGGKMIAAILQSGLSMYIMFLLNLPALVEPIPAPCSGTLTFGNVRTLTAVMSFPLLANTVISVVFAALQEDYPTTRLPALCWLLFLIPLFCVSILLYWSIRRAQQHSIIAHLWLILAVGQACGLLSVTCTLIGQGEFQTPTSLFDAIWIICVTFALHIHTILPDPPPPPLSLAHESRSRGEPPRTVPYTPPPTISGPIWPLRPALTASTEDFRTLQDPFASPSSPLTEKPFPLFEAERVEKARKKSISIILASTRHSSPADLGLPRKLLQSLKDDTPPPSLPASVLVRAPRHASYGGAFGA
ncbi:hypothetical protein BGW80DRAFT_1460830 [Lactifluus volemus]|nr:hypothetical protein BGW80DRAFT_1460830 [Lactifluus volemus]